MIQTQNNGENPHFMPNLGPLHFFFKNLVSSVAKYRPVQHQKNLRIQS